MTSPARDIALEALADRQGNVTARLDRLLADRRPSNEDRALARELAMGAVRRRRTCRAVVRSLLARPNAPMPAGVRRILELGVYQLLLLERVPDFAVVDEACRQTRRTQPRLVKLVNGVLRSCIRRRGELQAGPAPRQADVVPVGPGSWRGLDAPYAPDPTQDEVAWLGVAYSLPDALVRCWMESLGGAGRVVALAEHANARPPLVVRVDPGRSTLGEAMASMTAQGVDARPHVNGLSIVCPGGTDVTSLDAFQRGWVQPQDATASAVGADLSPPPGSAVLDLCAAPGGKTMHLASLMERRGRIVAVDVSGEKLARIERGCRRMGIGIVTPCHAESLAELEPESFELVLADVPCSNTGVLARRVEARWRFGEPALASLVADQKFLAEMAWAFVRPGGRLAYSTCSLVEAENAAVARWLGRRHGELSLEGESLTLPEGADDPTRWRDGGYLAVFSRR